MRIWPRGMFRKRNGPSCRTMTGERRIQPHYPCTHYPKSGSIARMCLASWMRPLIEGVGTGSQVGRLSRGQRCSGSAPAGSRGVEQVSKILEDETAPAMRLLGVDGRGLRAQSCQYKDNRKGSFGWARRLASAGGSGQGGVWRRRSCREYMKHSSHDGKRWKP
jgi:hypothetical protein